MSYGRRSLSHDAWCITMRELLPADRSILNEEPTIAWQDIWSNENHIWCQMTVRVLPVLKSQDLQSSLAPLSICRWDDKVTRICAFVGTGTGTRAENANSDFGPHVLGMKAVTTREPHDRGLRLHLTKRRDYEGAGIDIKEHAFEIDGRGGEYIAGVGAVALHSGSAVKVRPSRLR